MQGKELGILVVGLPTLPTEHFWFQLILDIIETEKVNLYN